MSDAKLGPGAKPWDDLLADPLVQLVMTADRVKPLELHELLLAAAGRRLALWQAVNGTAEVAVSLSPTDPAYRQGVGITLFNARGEVLVGRRRDTKPDAWQMPQGGIEPGEAPRDAALRELREEIGTDNVEVIAESRSWLRYDLPPHLVGIAWGGRWRGQQQKWFAMRFLGADTEITVATEHPEFAEWRWAPTAHALELIIGFKRQLYLDVLRDFGDVATPLRDPQSKVPTNPSADAERLRRALERVKSIAEGESGVLDVVACGVAAIGALRQLLVAREPSGLYEPRRHVVQALAALGAHDVLIDFLASPCVVTDPVERVGEEAVRNAAMRALVHCDDPRLPSLLLGMAETWKSSGAIEVLGSWRRLEALPCIVAALADDMARPAAETALRRFGATAAPILCRAAADRQPAGAAESESSKRRRRSSLALLLEVGCSVGKELSNDLEELCADEHPEIAALACRIQLASGNAASRRAAARRSIDLLGRINHLVRGDIEDALVGRPEVTRQVLASMAPIESPSAEDRSPAAMAARTLHRIAIRLGCEGADRASPSAA